MVRAGRTNYRTTTGVESSTGGETVRTLSPANPTIQAESRTGTLSAFRRTGTTTSHRSGQRGRRRGPLEAKQQQALQELLLASRERFVRVAYGILQNEDDAEDAVQDAFLSAYRHFGTFEGRAAVNTWLTRIVINAALMMRRRRQKTVLRSFHDLGTNDGVFVEKIPDVRLNPESAYAQAESFELVDALLGKMNPLLREAVAMAYYDELSIPEASSALGVPIATYKARLLRGRRFLQERAGRHRRRFISVS